jgi:hypothetical protein
MSIGLISSLSPGRAFESAVQPEPKGSVALKVLGLAFQAQGISIATPKGISLAAPTGSSAPHIFAAGLDAVRDEWEHALKNVRHGNMIDGRVLEPLLEAIQANRDKFPPGEFTIKLQWPDGASIATTIPAAGPTVKSVSVSALFVSATWSGQAPAASSAAARDIYGEWQ